MIVYADSFDIQIMDKYKILKKPSGNPHGNKKKYLDCVCAFDIETSTDSAAGVNWMYSWRLQIDLDYTIRGSTWVQFRNVLNALNAYLHDKDVYLVIYDHNLSYEFQYLKGTYPFTSAEVFATESRKVLKCEMYGCFEYRCSMFLTNMSLKLFLTKMKVEHQKQSGKKFDYDKMRYPWTPLSKSENLYTDNDVVGLVEGVKKQMELFGDDLYTIPLTSTGYPRRDMKHAMRYFSHNKIYKMQPDFHVFTLLRQAFRGGNCHANRYYSGKRLLHVSSHDRSSSYPDVMCNCEYPMAAWEQFEDPTPEIVKMLMDDHKAVLLSVGLSNVRLHRDDWGCPYLTKDKSRAINNGVYDNGRVLSADYLETTITDIDFKIILKEYDFDDIVIGECYYTEYGPLPSSFLNVVVTYYHDKTALKGKTEGDSELLYGKSKNLLNSLFGMLAQVPVKQNILFLDGVFSEAQDDPEELLAKNSHRTCSNYAWGVWTTAWARYRLEEGIDIVEQEPGSFVYCDTDSVKYIDHGQDWIAYNTQRIADSKKHDAWAIDSKGREHYMGVFEPDSPSRYRRFVTLGAKRYGYNDPKGKFHITISGVRKKEGASEMKNIKNFNNGFIFYHGGKTSSKYVDIPESNEYIADGKKIEIVPYIIIKDATYRLGLSTEYAELLDWLNNNLEDKI